MKVRAENGKVVRGLILDTSLISPLLDNDVDAFYLKDQTIRLRISGTTISLVSTKTDNTKSVANIATNVAQTYSQDFKFLEIHYYSSTVALIVYQYPTSATALTAVTARFVTLKFDDTILLGTAQVMSAVTSATVDVEGYILRGLYGDVYNIRKAITIATGAYSIIGYPQYYSFQTPNITYVNSANPNVSSNVLTYLPDMKKCKCSRGGFFYKNNSGVDFAYMYTNYYNSTARALALSAMGDELEVIGSENHYVLGLSKNGILFTIKKYPDTDYEDLYAWYYDHTSTTNLFKLIASARISFSTISNPAIMAFENDVIYYENGLRYQINPLTNDNILTIKELPKIDVSIISIINENTWRKITAESDPFNSFFVIE